MEHPNINKFHEICMVGVFPALKTSKVPNVVNVCFAWVTSFKSQKKTNREKLTGFPPANGPSPKPVKLQYALMYTSSLYIYISQDIARQDIVRTYILTSTYMFTLSLSESCSTWVYQSLVATKLTTPTSYIPAANIFPETTQSCSFALSFPLLGVNSAIKSSTLFPRIFAMAWYLGVQKFGLSDPHCHYSLEV